MDWLDSKTCEDEDKCYTDLEACDGTYDCKEGTDEKNCPGSNKSKAQKITHVPVCVSVSTITQKIICQST